MLLTRVAQFIAKRTNSEKAIYFLTVMSCSINKLKSYMLFTCKNFRYFNFFSRIYAPPFPLPLFFTICNMYYEHMSICFSSKFALRIPSVLLSLRPAVWSALSSLFPRDVFFAVSKRKPILIIERVKQIVSYLTDDAHNRVYDLGVCYR